MWTLDYLENSCNLSDLKYILMTLGGVPGRKNKREIIEDIIKIQNGDVTPAKSNRGRPRNSSKFNRYDIKQNEQVIKVCDFEKTFNYGDTVSGIVDLNEENSGFLRIQNYYVSQNDVYISPSVVSQCNLKTGDYICGKVSQRKSPNAELMEVVSINGKTNYSLERKSFDEMVPFYPKERIYLSALTDDKYLRMIDFIAPIAKGQRALLIAPLKSSKRVLTKKIACSIEQNYPDMHFMFILVDQAPEIITDFKMSVKGEVIGSTFEQSPEFHIKMVELAIARAKRLVENGQDTFIIIDSLSKIVKASNDILRQKGIVANGEINQSTLLIPKRIFASGRNLGEHSLTILATINEDDSSEFNTKVYEEFLDNSNMIIKLSKKLFGKRVYPEIDLEESCTDSVEELLKPNELEAYNIVKSAIYQDEKAQMNYINLMKITSNNTSFIDEINKN